MKKSKILVLFMVLVMTLSVFAGCGGTTKPADQKASEPTKAAVQTPAKEKVIRFNNSVDPRSIDPATEASAYEFTVENQMFEGLTRQSPNGLVPGIATEWKISDDGLKYTFKLRDAKFSNGDPLTADDFVYSWQRALDPMLASEYAFQLYYLKGAEVLNNIDAKAADAAAQIAKAKSELGVKALDPKTLEVTLADPTPYFLALTAFPTYHPVDKKIVDANKDWATKPETYICNGPYKLTQWNHGDKLVLSKNENYWDIANVKVDKIEMYMVDQGSTELTMWETGQIDITFGDLPSAELARLDKEGKLKSQPLIGTMYFAPQNQKAPLNDVKVRKALSMALDRKSLTTNVIRKGSIPAYAYVPSGIGDADQGQDFRKVGGDLFKEDIAQAKQLLADAGFPDGKGFPGFEIVYTTNELTKAIVEASLEMWKKNLNITNITARNVESKVRLEKRKSGDFQFTYTGWYGDYLDPMTFSDVAMTKNGQNEMKFKNDGYDKLVAEAKKTLDPKKRMQMLHDAEKILFDNMGVIPIYFEAKAYLQNDKVTNVFRNALNLIDFKWADVSTK